MTMMKDNAAGRQTLVSSVLIELRKKTRSLPSLERNVVSFTLKAAPSPYSFLGEIVTT